MFSNPLFYYSCGHISHLYLAGKAADFKHEKICPRCRQGTVSNIEFDCELCGAPTQTTASGFQRSQRLFCASCRKIYNNWDCMARKARNTQRSFPDLQEYLKTKEIKPPNSKDIVRDPEPPLQPQEFKDIAAFGQRRSPCALCSYITNDKNETPCSTCTKLSTYHQNPDKIFLDSLYE